MLVFKGFKFQKTNSVGSVLAVLPKFQRVQYIILNIIFRSFMKAFRTSTTNWKVCSNLLLCFLFKLDRVFPRGGHHIICSFPVRDVSQSDWSADQWSSHKKGGGGAGGGNELGSEKAGENALMSRTSLDILEKPHNWQPGEGIICYRDLVTLRYFFSPGIQ